jgi:hypothetical protein
MIDEQVKQLAVQLAIHRYPFAPFGPWEVKDAFLPLDMHRFVGANEANGKFPPQKRRSFSGSYHEPDLA